MLVSSRATNILLIIMIAIGIGIVAMLATGVRGGPLDPPGPLGSTDSMKLPGTPISTAPFIITSSGHYYLTRDLTINGAGVAISFAEHVDFATLDLNGFTVTGANSGTGIRALGPSAPSQFPLQITNGYVRNFAIGVDVQNSAHARIDGVHAFSNGTGFALGNHAVVTNCTAALGSAHGILLSGGLNAIHGCMIVDNTQSGVHITGAGNVIEDSQILRNDVNVRFVGGADSIVRGNDLLFASSSTAIFGDGNGNSIIENTYCGLFLTGNDNLLLNNLDLC